MARISAPSWSATAWGAIGVTTLFIGITVWWLTQDRSVPIFDAGLHLSLALEVHHQLSSGHLFNAFTLTVPYPPFTYLVGSLGILIGGVGVAPLIIVENVFFVTLLALGCYHVGRLAFGPLAGLLAVVFALGSPLIIAQFHVFMTDAPETAMVAVSLWLILASKGFSDLRVSALAGLSVGIAMLTKEPAAIFVVGVIGVTAVRGGWRAWPGMAIFAAVTLVVALPWYIHELGQIQSITSEATSSSRDYLSERAHVPPGVAPPRLSRANLEWYLWNFLNTQLFLPLFIFSAVGWIWTLVGFVRRRSVSPLALELTVGSFIAWLILTQTFVHDSRYSMPLLIYMAVFGAGWIVKLPRRGRIAATSVLVLVAVANTLGASFGVGKPVHFSVSSGTPTALNDPGGIVLYSNGGYLVAGPNRDGDLIAMLQALRRNGVRAIQWAEAQSLEPDFSTSGVTVLAQIAGLEVTRFKKETEIRPGDAYLFHPKSPSSEPPPCVELSDGTGVWVQLAGEGKLEHEYYCPSY